MIGVKIAMTGTLAMMLAGLVMIGIGKKCPHWAIALTLVSLLCLGAAAVFVGLLWSIWA